MAQAAFTLEMVGGRIFGVAGGTGVGRPGIDPGGMAAFTGQGGMFAG